MSHEAQQLAVTLLKSTTKYVFKKTEGAYNKEVYLAAMRSIVALVEHATNFDSAVNAALDACIVPQYHHGWLFKRRNPDYYATNLARQHAADIMDSVKKRFVLGLQNDCPKFWEKRALHTYSDDVRI